jgi:hypothetical protein
MKATIRDPEILRTVRPLEVIAYLRSQGWQEAQRLERGAFWIKTEEAITHEVLIPFEATSHGYLQRIVELLAVLEEAESRSQIEIVEDLSFASADIIRPRLLGAFDDGTISIEDGKAVYEHARSLMLSAACAAVEPRQLYAKRKPEQAMNYLNHARFGVPQRGSYILTIISPVSPKLVLDSDLFGEVQAEEPFERRTVRILAQAIEQASIAGRETAATGDFAPMSRAVAHGVSANLCDALVALHHCSGERGVDFHFTWAPSRGMPDNTKSSVTIASDLVPILEEASRLFRETGTQNDVEVLGTVHKLEHQEGSRGKVTINGTADGIPRTVQIELSGDEHSLAVRSYEERIPLSCRGELMKEGRSWALKNPRDVALFETATEE